MKNWNKKIATFVIPMMVTGMALESCSYNSFRGVANEEARSAYQVYADLQESATSFNAKAVMVDGELVVDGMDAGVTWGAEKEASSGLITRVMSPPAEGLKQMVSGMEESSQREFLLDFFSNYVKNANGYRTFKNEEGVVIDYARDVVDNEGNPKVIDMEPFRSIDFENVTTEELVAKWNQFLDMTDDRPLTFMKPSVRMKMFKAQLPGMSERQKLKNVSGYHNWKATFGKAQNYVRDAHATSVGWEINFSPNQTYGEFEEFVMWFRTELKNAGRLFQAPGHQRMVFRRHPNLDEAKLSELYRAIQALIIADGIQGKTGIESASYKSVLNDSTLQSLNSGRGVIRLERSRWGDDNYGVEFRAGTKDIRAARFYQTTLAARVATNDFSGLADIGDYSLYTGDGYSLNAEEISQKFNVPLEKVQKAAQNIQAGQFKLSYMIPFWDWTNPNLPFLSASKKRFIESLTRDFILQVAELEGANIKADLKSLLRSWVKSTKLGDELRNYIKPRRMASQTDDLLHFSPPEGRPVVAGALDVNNIDLGIEYSGKFPLALDAQYSPERLQDNKKAWLQTRIDLTLDERKQVLKNVAEDLLKNLGGEGEAQEVIDAGGHGHGLEVAYEIRDPQDRKWVVEWDGIGRSYSEAGEIVEDSIRGGSIELVTPKFVPQVEDMEAVYKAFDENSILPTIKHGGGHINIDLAAFENNPKAVGRFMALFHEHRGIISMMFQYVNRLKSAEPIDIDPAFNRQLANFTGTDDELKKLLYNNEYFNTRYGRKTRYNQLDMSAYYQDVIPEEFLTDDFDINSPTDPWRRTFRADPRIRKAEFRLFNAPRDPMESALQIRLVRALLHKAINEDTPLDGTVQKVDHISYLQNTDKAYDDLAKLCDELGLDINDYRPALAEGLSDTDMAHRSAFFEPLSQKLANHPKQRGWGQAVEPRSADNAIASEGRQWTPGPADELNTMTHEQRVQAAAAADRQRAAIVPAREVPGDFVRSDSCVDLVGAFL